MPRKPRSSENRPVRPSAPTVGNRTMRHLQGKQALITDPTDEEPCIMVCVNPHAVKDQGEEPELLMVTLAQLVDIRPAFIAELKHQREVAKEKIERTLSRLEKADMIAGITA